MYGSSTPGAHGVMLAAGTISIFHIYANIALDGMIKMELGEEECI
jgi:hypothetical protein